MMTHDILRLQSFEMLTVVFFLFCFLFSNIFSQIIPLRFDQAIYRLHQYQHFSPDDLFRNEQYNLTPEKIFQYMSTSVSNNETSQCKLDFDVVLGGASEKTMWALKVLDAWGKPLPSSVLKGNTYWVGDYNECLKPMYYSANKSFMLQPFDTQHCTLTPANTQNDRNPMPPIVLGVCVPSSCDRRGVISIIDRLYKKTNLTEDEIVCSNDPSNGQKGLTYGAIATIIILSILGVVVLVGTIIDLILLSRLDAVGNITSNINGYDFVADGGTTQPVSINLPQNSRYSIRVLIDAIPGRIFLAEFSAVKTLRRIFTMKQKDDKESYPFINGIRVLALFWVIIGHSLSFGLSYTENALDVLVWSHNIAFQLIINAVLSVDTFFVISGFLTAILFVRQVKKEKKISLRLMFLYYIHRYIRLTPTFLLMILVSINLTPYLGSGPVYPTQQGFEPNGCRTQYWWTSILYVGNIVKPDDMCLGIAWYLHNDMQFHWIAPLSLIPFVIGKKSFSYFITILFVFTGIASTATILLYYPNMSLNTLTAFTNDPGPTFFKNVYITPWCRISAYAIGIFTGYCVIDVGRLYRMNRSIKFVVTILTILTGFACLFTTYPDYILASGLDRSILIAYQSLVRTLWSICIGWLLFLCSINQGGIVDKILSWPIWSPFARLNYSCYLVHTTIILIILTNQIRPMYYQGHLIVNNFISHIFFSYAAAILVAIFFETPFFIIEKKIFKR